MSLIEMMLADQDSDHQKFIEAIKLRNGEKLEESDEAHDSESGSDSDDNANDEEFENAPVLASLDSDAVDYKDLITMEIIKDAAGEIMYSCRDTLQYEMTKRIMNAVTYEKSLIRPSFLQELIDSQEKASYREAL